MIEKVLISLGYPNSIAEPCLFYKKKGDRMTSLLLLYVDDILLAGSSAEKRMVFSKLEERFKLKTKEEAVEFIGLNLVQQQTKDVRIKVNNTKYI